MRRRMKRIPPSTPRRGHSIIGVILAVGGLVAWILLSDEWDAILNDRSATTALGVAVGFVMSAVLLTLIALLSAATQKRRQR